MGIQIRAMVVGLVVALVGLALYPVYAQATDRLYRQFVQSCQVQGDTVLRLHDADQNTFALREGTGTTTTGCVVPTSDLASSTPVMNEDNLVVNTVAGTATVGGTGNTVVSGGVWRTLSPVLTRFGTINQLLAQILDTTELPNTPNTCLLYTSPSPRDS